MDFLNIIIEDCNLLVKSLYEICYILITTPIITPPSRHKRSGTDRFTYDKIHNKIVSRSGIRQELIRQRGILRLILRKLNGAQND